MLQVQAETQVLKETERKWEEGLVSVFQLMESRNRLLSAKAEQVRTRLQYELALRLADYYRTVLAVFNKNNILIHILNIRKGLLRNKFMVGWALFY